MYNEANHAAILLALALPALLLVVAAVKSSSVWIPRLRSWPTWQRALAVVGVGVAIIYGGEKPGPVTPPQDIVEILTLRADGSLRDLSGKIAPGIQAKAVSDYIGASAQIVSAADAILDQARLDCVALTNQILTADYTAAYISLDLPRGTPVETNHNIMISFERVEQTPTNLTAYVWFSESPATNVTVNVEYSLAEGVWSTLPAVTNSFPTTYSVSGVDCYRYCYAIPDGIAGTPLRPQYEVEFGGYAANQYLSVPEEGVVVSTNGVDCLPYTGWDDYSAGEDTLTVRYVGGIAVEAVYQAEPIKGGSGS